MADAKKCDRCGKFYIKNEQEFIGCVLKHFSLMGSNNMYFDLCDECIGRLWTFLVFPIETDDTIDHYNQSKEDDKRSDDTSTLDTTKMSVKSYSSL